ncbi:uncharacterized protein LOC110159392 isoform X2 [Boleophthalmus pectinirostris]|uniref:uncharacterized protein LOC110159392 isoform X2 n=1 Tax=Boleophthalmus pectinirostris TaxID=150288 RepID=UPI00242AE63C|nr:uncharacterized protein LOC110159392 isoform X2 [Boleophthalmus pectinirostris]
MAPTAQDNCLATLLRAGLFVTGCTILVVCSFPMVQIVMGAVYVSSCPVAPALPVYLMVSGVGTLLFISLLALPPLLCPDRHRSSLWTLCMLCLGLVFLAWFLYGSYVIYSVYPPQYTDNSTSKTLVTSGPGPTHSWTPTHAGPSTTVTSGPRPTHAGPSTAVTSSLGPTHSGPSTAVSSGPGLTHSGPSAAVRSGPRSRRSGPSAAVRSGPAPTNSWTPTHSGLSARASSSHTGASGGGRSAEVSSGLYCHRSLYLFAFWTHTLVYVFAAHTLVFLLCFCCFMKVSAVMVSHLTT